MERNLVDKGVDADELDVADEVDEHGREQHRPARRWWIGGGAVIALLAAGSVAFLVTRDDEAAGDDASGDGAIPTAVPPGDVQVPTLDWRLVIGEVPEDYRLQWINSPELQDGGFEEFGAVQRIQLLAAAGADFDDGPWMATEVQLLDRFERRNFDPMNYVDASQATSTRVGAYLGAFHDDPFAGASTLLFGPVDDGYAVSISFGGIDRAAVSRVAAELTIDDPEGGPAPRAVLGPAAAELGLEPLADYETRDSWGIGSGPGLRSLFGGSGDATSITYESDIGGLTLTNQPLIPGLDALTLGGFLLTDEEAVTVHGLPALVGDFGGFGFDITAVVWVEGGRSISLIGVFEPDDLVAIAESVREAGPEEFDELLAQVEEFRGGDPGALEEAWLLGTGDLEDSTTWTVEGGIDLDGAADAISLASSSSSPSESSSGFGESVDVVVPSIVAGPWVGLRTSVPTLIAMVDIGQDGAVLRFTADDGTVTESPVRIVRDDWPVRVVAIAIEQPGRVELIGSDGAVLAEKEFSEDDLLQGDVAGPAETVPADTAGG